MNSASPLERSPVPNAEAPRDCPLCPRLVALRRACRDEHPDWWNAPVPAFGDPDAWLAIIGLAPGKHGANRTGRPFTGDYAGDLLYATLAKFGLSDGQYDCSPRGRPDVERRGHSQCGQMPSATEQDDAGGGSELPALPYQRDRATAQSDDFHRARERLRTTAFAGRSKSRLRGLNLPMARNMPARGTERLIDSYHCSRYNQNTRRLDAAMFEAVFEAAINGRPDEIRTERLLLRRARARRSCRHSFDHERSCGDALLVDPAPRGHLADREMASLDDRRRSVRRATISSSNGIGRVIGKLGCWKLPEIGFPPCFRPMGAGGMRARQWPPTSIDDGPSGSQARSPLTSTRAIAHRWRYLTRHGFVETDRKSGTWQVGDEICDSVYLAIELN